MALEIIRIPVLSDNYVWLVHEPESGETMAVDPAVAEPVLAEAEARGSCCEEIWWTCSTRFIDINAQFIAVAIFRKTAQGRAQTWTGRHTDARGGRNYGPSILGWVS